MASSGGVLRRGPEEEEEEGDSGGQAAEALLVVVVLVEWWFTVAAEPVVPSSPSGTPLKPSLRPILPSPLPTPLPPHGVHGLSCVWLDNRRFPPFSPPSHSSIPRFLWPFTSGRLHSLPGPLVERSAGYV